MSSAAVPIPAAKPPARPDLEPKRAPLQPRAVETYERILAACAELLGEVGIERLSTNLVCQRAGISPPALYQYFPNKYAILHELSLRLMRQQNELLAPWAVRETMALPPAEFAASMAALFVRLQTLTAQMPAGIWVTRAQRAVPALQSQRLRSRDLMTDMVLAPFLEVHPAIDPAQARLTLRLAIDALYSAHELLFDEPSLDPQAVAQTMAEMVAGQLERLVAGG